MTDPMRMMRLNSMTSLEAPQSRANTQSQSQTQTHSLSSSSHYLAHLYPPSIVVVSEEYALPEPDIDSPLSSAPGSPTRRASGSPASSSGLTFNGDGSGRRHAEGERGQHSGTDQGMRTAPPIKLCIHTQNAHFALPPKPYYMRDDDPAHGPNAADATAPPLLPIADEKKDEDAPDDEMMGTRPPSGPADPKIPATTTILDASHAKTTFSPPPPQRHKQNLSLISPDSMGGAMGATPLPIKATTPITAKTTPATAATAGGADADSRLLQARRIVERAQGMRRTITAPTDEGQLIPSTPLYERAHSRPPSVPMDEMEATNMGGRRPTSKAERTTTSGVHDSHANSPHEIPNSRSNLGVNMSTNTSTNTSGIDSMNDSTDDMSEPGALPSPPKRHQPLSLDTSEAKNKQQQYELPNFQSQPGRVVTPENDKIAATGSISTTNSNAHDNDINAVAGGRGADGGSRIHTSQRASQRDASAGKSNQKLDLKSTAGRQRTSELLARYTNMSTDKKERDTSNPDLPMSSATPAASASSSLVSRNKLRARDNNRNTKQNSDRLRDSPDWIASEESSSARRTPSTRDNIIDVTEMHIDDQRVIIARGTPQGYSPEPQSTLDPRGSDTSSDPYFDDDNFSQDDDQPADELGVRSQRRTSHSNEANAPPSMFNDESRAARHAASIRSDAHLRTDDMPDDERKSPKNRSERQSERYIGSDVDMLAHHGIGRRMEEATPRKSGSSRTDTLHLIHKYTAGAAPTHHEDEPSYGMRPEPAHHQFEDGHEWLDSAHSARSGGIHHSMSARSRMGSADEGSYVSGSHADKVLSTTNSSIVSGNTASTTNWVDYLGHMRSVESALSDTNTNIRSTLSKDEMATDFMPKASIGSRNSNPHAADQYSHTSDELMDPSSVSNGDPRVDRSKTTAAKARVVITASPVPAPAPAVSAAPSYREMTPKKDLLSSENSAWWLQQEFSRRSIIKKEINDAIISRSIKSTNDDDNDDDVKNTSDELRLAEIERTILSATPPVPMDKLRDPSTSDRRHADRPPLPMPSGNASHQPNEVIAFASQLSNALSGLPQQNSMVSMDDSEIAAYNKHERDLSQTAPNQTAVAPSHHQHQRQQQQQHDHRSGEKTGNDTDVARRLSYSVAGENGAPVRSTRVPFDVGAKTKQIDQNLSLLTNSVSGNGIDSIDRPQGASSSEYRRDKTASPPAYSDKQVAEREATNKWESPNVHKQNETESAETENRTTGATLAAEMKRFASNTRAALRGTIGLDTTSQHAASRPQSEKQAPTVGAPTQPSIVRLSNTGAHSPFRSIAAPDVLATSQPGASDKTQSMRADHQPRNIIQPKPGNRNIAAATAAAAVATDNPNRRIQVTASSASGSTAKSNPSDFEDAHSSPAPVLIDTMDSVIGICKGDITLSLLNEENIPTDEPEKAIWAARVQDSVWRCRHMRRNMGALGGKKAAPTPGSPANRSSLPVDLDQGRVAGGFRSVGSTQEAALQHLRHDEIDEAVELYEDIIFAYYGYFERSLKAREKNAHAQDSVGVTDFKPYLGVALHNLGILNLLNGDHSGALSFFTRAVENRKKCLGEGHPDHVASLVKHALCLYALHEFAGAHTELELALRLMRDRCTSIPDQMQMSEVLNNLGCLLYMCGQPMPAKAYFKESLDIQFQSLSESLYSESPMLGHSISISISVTRANIGFLKMVNNDLPVAITALEAALMEQQLLLDGAHDTLIATMDHLAVANMLDGKHDKAAAMFGRILQLQYSAFGPHDQRCYVTMEKIKMVRSRGKDFELALSELRKTFSIPAETTFNAHPERGPSHPPPEASQGRETPSQPPQQPQPRRTRSQPRQAPPTSKSKGQKAGIGIKKGFFTSIRRKKGSA